MNHRNNRMIVAAALDLIHNVSNMTAVLFLFIDIHIIY
mgnify:CR=1 FL=1